MNAAELIDTARVVGRSRILNYTFELGYDVWLTFVGTVRPEPDIARFRRRSRRW